MVVKWYYLMWNHYTGALRWKKSKNSFAKNIHLEGD